MSKQDELYWQGRDFLNDLIDQIPAAIFWKNSSSVFLGCNQYFANFAAIPSPQFIIGKTDYDLPWQSREASLYIQDDLQVMFSRQPKLGIEEPQTLFNGEKRILLTNKIPLFSKSGKIVGILGIFHDITLRKKMELSLEQARMKAELANRAKTEFIANMSHDIRTPLSGIIGLSKLLEESSIQQEYQQYARWINESSEQLLSLLNGILDALTVENTSELALKYEAFDLNRCLNDIVQLERPMTQLKGIDLKVEIQKEVPSYIISDATKLHRILLNLVGNAAKFTRVGHVTIRVELLSREGKQVKLRFSVQDTGIGISPEAQQKVFDRFFRANPSYKGHYSGHGVGLHIAKSYVELLNSQLNLTSELGVGTTFSFDLSAEVEIRAVYEVSQDSPTASQVKPFVKHAIQVLIVEDNTIAQKMTEILVTQAGGHASVAANGEEAWQRVTTGNYDLILTDIGLPGISGYELARSIREWEEKSQKSKVPIVGLTAHIHERAKEEYLASGMDAVLCKPINLSSIQSIIEHFVLPKQEITEESSENILEERLPENEVQLFSLEHFVLLNIDHAAMCSGSQDLLLEVLTLMTEHEIPSAETTIQQAYAQQDWAQIGKMAHKMKGGAVYCGTEKLQYACQYLEHYYKAGHTEHLDKLYFQLVQVLKETQQAILKVLSTVEEGVEN